MAGVVNYSDFEQLFLDVEAMKKVVNGLDSEDVTTRLGKIYPTFAKALKIIQQVGGAKAYKILADAQADVKNLSANTPIFVLADSTDKNGLYLYDGINLLASEYDALKQAKLYADQQDAITKDQVKSDLNPVVFKRTSAKADIALSFPFSDGTLTWLTVLKNGTPPQFVIDHLASRLGIKAYNSYSRIDKITCLGDSLTEGGTGDGTTYPNFLKDMMPNGTDVINKGGSGQLSLPIGLRYGAIILKLNANTIPTSGSVKFTFSSITDTANGQPFNAKRNGSISGTIAGVKGVFTLSTVDGNDEFVPSVYPSSPVVVPQDAIFYPDLTNVDYEATLIFWSGQNDLAVGWPYWETAPVDTARACVNMMRAEKKKVLIIGVTTTSANALGVVQKQNINLKAYVGELVADGHDAAFLDIQADLTNLTILASLGIDITNQDVINSVNAGLIPKVATADEIHFTATIKKNYTAYQIKRIFATKGWL